MDKCHKKGWFNLTAEWLKSLKPTSNKEITEWKNKTNE
jgi:hypothetical protein